MKRVKLKTTVFAACLFAIAAGSWKAYDAYSNNKFGATSLLSNNIEALSMEVEGSTTSCDLTTHNVGYMEGWQPVEVKKSKELGLHVIIKDKKYSLSGSYTVGQTIFYSTCLSSPGNCCEKSWAENVQFRTVI